MSRFALEVFIFRQMSISWAKATPQMLMGLWMGTWIRCGLPTATCLIIELNHGHGKMIEGHIFEFESFWCLRGCNMHGDFLMAGCSGCQAGEAWAPPQQRNLVALCGCFVEWIYPTYGKDLPVTAGLGRLGQDIACSVLSGAFEAVCSSVSCHSRQDAAGSSTTVITDNCPSIM